MRLALCLLCFASSGCPGRDASVVKVDKLDAQVAALIVEKAEANNTAMTYADQIKTLTNENTGLKAEITGLQANIDASKQAGGDINSTVALISAIFVTPLCFFLYVIAERFPMLRSAKDYLKGKPNGCEINPSGQP